MREGFTDILYNGNDFILSKTKGVEETDSLVNMIILGIFGGNVEASEPISRKEDEIINSYWGNSHGYNENSKTERFLRSLVLSSSTPKKVEQVVLSDLEYLNEHLNIECEVSIPYRDRLQIDIYISRKKEKRTSKMSIVWGLLADGGGDTPSGLLGFDFVLDFKMM